MTAFNWNNIMTEELKTKKEYTTKDELKAVLEQLIRLLNNLHPDIKESVIATLIDDLINETNINPKKLSLILNQLESSYGVSKM